MMNSLKNHKTLVTLLLVLAVTWVLAFVYEPKLPEEVPTHWNIDGEIDGYTAKPWGVFMLPLISTLTSLLLMLLPLVAPKGFQLGAAKKVYEIIVLVVALFMLGVMLLSFHAALNQDVDMNQWIMVGLGALFLILGNYLSKVPKNFFLGIRTPWTLASDEVWYKTHRLGSWVFVLVGLLVILGSFLNWPFAWLMGLLAGSGLILVIYSLLAYRKLEGFKE